METDFEQRLREVLHARAAEVQPDPRTWDRVQAGIRRGVWFRLLSGGAREPARPGHRRRRPGRSRARLTALERLVGSAADGRSGRRVAPRRRW
jgi:hypothetical protein